MIQRGSSVRYYSILKDRSSFIVTKARSDPFDSPNGKVIFLYGKAGYVLLSHCEESICESVIGGPPDPGEKVITLGGPED